MTIEIASQIRTNALRPYIDRIIAVMEFHGALVTDRSTIGDFLGLWDDPVAYDAQMAAWAAALDVPLTPQTALVEIAEVLAGRVDGQ